MDDAWMGGWGALLLICSMWPTIYHICNVKNNQSSQALRGALRHNKHLSLLTSVISPSDRYLETPHKWCTESRITEEKGISNPWQLGKQRQGEVTLCLSNLSHKRAVEHHLNHLKSGCGGEMTSQKTKTSLGHLPEWGDLGGRCGAAPKDCYMSIQYIILLVSLNTLLFIVTRLFLQEVLSDWTPLVKDSDDSFHPPGQKTR